MKYVRPALIAIGACAWLAAGAAQPATPEVIQSAALEQFLSHAKIVAMKDIGRGVTQSRRATLQMDGTTHAAVFKIIDEKPMIGVQKLDGGAEAEFQDSWRTEVAAYELDKLIGLGMVPTTVERTYESQKGSLQFWVDNIMDEKKRQQTHTMPPNPVEWNDQMAKLVLWDNLIYNTDRNLNHILITASWHMVAIDHSRTFRPFNFRAPRPTTAIIARRSKFRVAFTYGASSSNSSTSPAFKFNRRRRPTGSVICPFEVSVACIPSK